MSCLKFKLSVITGVLFLSAGAANAGSISVLLDEANQGKGNKGLEFRPVTESGLPADFLMTAMSSINDSDPFNPWAAGLAGTVYIEKNEKGAGVQTADAKGSKLLSGGGAHNDEQLMFTFDTFALSSSVKLGFTEFDPGNGLNDKDDTILYITFLDSTTQVLTEVNYMGAFQSTGKKTGFIDFSLLDLDGEEISSIWARETNGHMGLSGIEYSASVVPLPPAVLLGMAGLGIFGIARRRKLI